MFRVPYQCCMFVLSLCLSTSVWAVTIEATVTRVSGNDLELTLKDARQQPKPGDAVDIFFPIPGGDRISIGVWRVDTVDGQKVSVSVVRHTGKPMLGYLATIQLSDNRDAKATDGPPAAIEVPAAQKTPPAQGEQPARSAAAADMQVAARPEARSQVSAEVQQLILQLRSSSPAEKRKAVRAVHRSHLHDETLQAAVEDELLKGHTLRTRDKQYIDAMAWMCNVLGDSGNHKFAATLKQVYREAKNRKLRKYAKINYRKIR